MKFGIRTPSLKKRIAARTSWKRVVRHNLGFKAPRGWGWLTNPKRAAYNRVYNRTSVSVDRLFSSKRRRKSSGGSGIAVVLIVGAAIAAAVGVYLLVIAAVALVGWIIRVAARSRSGATSEPPHESAPAVEYEQVAEVDPGVFEDDERVKRAARIVFSGWAAPVVVNIAASGAIVPAQVPSSVPHECWSQLRSALHPGERITGQRLVIAERPCVKVSYAVRGVTDAVTFVGPKMLARADAHDQAFTARARLLSRIEIVLAIIPASLTVFYVARGPYFVTCRAGTLVAGAIASAAVFALCVYAMTWYATLRRRAARAWGVAAIAAMVAAAWFAIGAEPSVARARGYLASGQLDAAAAELDALGTATKPALASTWADLHLKEALAASSCGSAAATAAKIPTDLRRHAAAIGHADELAIREARAELDRRGPVAASAALDCASPGTRDGQTGRKIGAEIKLAAGEACLRASDWECVFARAGEADSLGATVDAAALRGRGLEAVQATFRRHVTAARSEKRLEDRARLEHTALDLWALYIATHAAKEPTEIAGIKTSIARDDAAIARAQELERRRAAADERRRIAAEQHERALQEAAERRERARQEAAERARAYSPLVCADGTLSPTCVCGGSWRGCCSHHHGVSGCQGQ